jgi:hypothetical protein
LFGKKIEGVVSLQYWRRTIKRGGREKREEEREEEREERRTYQVERRRHAPTTMQLPSIRTSDLTSSYQCLITLRVVINQVFIPCTTLKEEEKSTVVAVAMEVAVTRMGRRTNKKSQREARSDARVERVTATGRRRRSVSIRMLTMAAHAISSAAVLIYLVCPPCQVRFLFLLLPPPPPPSPPPPLRHLLTRSTIVLVTAASLYQNTCGCTTLLLKTFQETSFGVDLEEKEVEEMSWYS